MAQKRGGGKSDRQKKQPDPEPRQAYPHSSQADLGDLIRVSRESMGWSLEQIVDLINAALLPEPKYTYHSQRSIEIAPTGRKAPPADTLFWLANLARLHPPFLQNPKTGEPYNELDLLKIAQGAIDWGTGEEIKL